MRTLHLDSGNEMRGGQWQALRLIDGLTAEGVECTLLARPGSPLFEAARARGWRVAPLALWRAAAFARRRDLVHAHDSRSHTLAALAGGAPLVVARRVAFAPERNSALSRWKYRRAGRYIAVSEFVKRALIERGIAADRIDVAYDGVPLLPCSAPADPPFVVAPFSDDPRKGMGLAIEAAKLAGVELRLSKTLERELHGAAALVYLTYSEGLGSGALLAMSAGVPVVASDVGGLPEIVRPGENGLLAANEPAAVANAIRKIVDDRRLRAQLGAGARRTVAERFTVEILVRRTMEVYRRALS